MHALRTDVEAGIAPGRFECPLRARALRLDFDGSLARDRSVQLCDVATLPSGTESEPCLTVLMASSCSRREIERVDLGPNLISAAALKITAIASTPPHHYARFILPSPCGTVVSRRQEVYGLLADGKTSWRGLDAADREEPRC